MSSSNDRWISIDGCRMASTFASGRDVTVNSSTSPPDGVLTCHEEDTITLNTLSKVDSQSDVDVDNEHACSACTYIRKIEAQLASAERSLLQMRHTLPELRRRRNAVHSPILRVPLEIVFEILELCLVDSYSEWDEEWDKGQKKEESQVAVEAVTSSSQTFAKRRRERMALPLLFGAICRGWRDIAWSNPRLWSSIWISLPSTTTTTKNKPTSPSDVKLTNAWIRRSGGVPLSLFMQIDIDSDERGDPPSEDLGALMEVVNRCAEHWRLLAVHAPARYLGSFFHGNGNANKSSGSMLRTLVLSNATASRDSQTPDEPEPEAAVVAPSNPLRTTDFLHAPEHIVLRGIPPLTGVQLDWTNARSVDLTLHPGARKSDLIELLERAPLLRRLRLAEFGCPWRGVGLGVGAGAVFGGEEPEVSRDVVIHYGISELEISSASMALARELIMGNYKTVRFPGLKSLSWSAWSSHAPPPPSSSSSSDALILSLLARSSCVLTELVLSKTHRAAEEFIPLLSGIPSLEKLTIAASTSCQVPVAGYVRDDQLFALLARTAGDEDALSPGRTLKGGKFLPRLRSLRLTMQANEKWWTYVPAVFGPLAGVGTTTTSRRPLRVLRVEGMREYFPASCVGVNRLVKIVPYLRAGFDVRFVDEMGVDILRESVDRFGLLGGDDDGAVEVDSGFIDRGVVGKSEYQGCQQQ